MNISAFICVVIVLSGNKKLSFLIPYMQNILLFVFRDKKHFLCFPIFHPCFVLALFNELETEKIFRMKGHFFSPQSFCAGKASYVPKVKHCSHLYIMVSPEDFSPLEERSWFFQNLKVFSSLEKMENISLPSVALWVSLWAWVPLCKMGPSFNDIALQ